MLSQESDRLKAGLQTTFPDHPNSDRNRGAGNPARHAVPGSHLFGPDIPLRCSTANPSSEPHIRAAPDYDEHNSKSASNVDPSASLDSAEEDLSSASTFFGVPSVRSTAVKPSQLIDQTFDVCRLNERVIVIRQHAPCEGLVRMRC